MVPALAIFAPWLRQWDLTPDGPAFTTPFLSHLMPVRLEGRPAMLKLSNNQEEREGAHLMVWYDGDGAAEVLAHEGDCLLLERATGLRSLRAMALSGQDDQACTIICSAVARLHQLRAKPLPPMLAPLPVWFRQLAPAAAREGGVLAKSAAAAAELLAKPQDQTVLHGDIHHDNILDAGPRGWIAIDPKGLYGERGYDYANSFCNPNLAVAGAPGRLARRIEVISAAANLDPSRLLKWVLAYAGLSAAWSLDESADPTLALAVATIAANQLQA